MTVEDIGRMSAGAVAVSFKKKRATVTFDDNKTNVAALTAATANVGFPSRVIE
jgi:mercuric ion binding protein